MGIYLAKYTYVPADMSPNENHDLELPLTAGDYLYVYGEMDSDGFYHGQLLSSGQSGMVPSNFIEKVMDEEGVAGKESGWVGLGNCSMVSVWDLWLCFGSGRLSEDGSIVLI